MANLTIEMPDDLARRLDTIAAAQHCTVQELAVERLRTLVAIPVEPPPGSAAALLRAMNEPPHLNASDVPALEAAIAAGRHPLSLRPSPPNSARI